MSRLKEIWEEEVETASGIKKVRKEKLYPRRFDSYTVTEAPCKLTDMATGAEFDALSGNQLKFELDIPDSEGNIVGVETLYFPFGHTVYVESDDRKNSVGYPQRVNRQLAVAEK